MAALTKRYDVHALRRRPPLLIAVGILLAGAAAMQSVIDPTAKKYQPSNASIEGLGGLNNEFLLLPLLGFREAAAGLLWVRCDEFFHSGDYDAILPLVRIITLLDPHADNVYVTGAWHLAYNFTDSNERSDRRYIPPAQAFLDQGIGNNMAIPDIKFEKGWQCYDKIKDYIEAEKALKLALATPPNKTSDDYPYGAPLKVMHLLAHTYEKQGRIPEALDAWKQALNRSTEMMERRKREKQPEDYGTKQLHAAEQHNYDETLQRYRDRYTASGHSPVNPSPYPAVLRPAPGETRAMPWDCSFQPKLETKRAKVFKISGRLNVADGARVEVRITDWDFKEPSVSTQTNPFEVDQSQTILVDAISVRKNKFEREMDMSKDPKMYSFSQPYYRVVLTFNTRITSPHLQDRHGWSGEGITDSNAAHVLYDSRPELLGTALIAGQGATGPLWDSKNEQWREHSQPPRLIRVTYKISKDQVMNLKPITNENIVPSE